MELEKISSLSVRELRQQAASRMIPGRSEMNKSELVNALSEYSLEERIRRLEARVSALESSDSIHHGVLG
jgi:hypothetical protein